MKKFKKIDIIDYAINLSILDFKFELHKIVMICVRAINLSILDFKLNQTKQHYN